MNLQCSGDTPLYKRDKPVVSCKNSVHFGDKYVQLGKWRFGDVDGKHFSVSHKDGKTAQVYTSDGKRLGADHKRTTYDGRSADNTGVFFGDRFVQIGNFRICDIDGRHASICSLDGQTSQIFRNDGRLYPGPRTDYCCNERPIDSTHWNAPKVGDRYLQIGEWRLGAIDDKHASISHEKGKTPQIYRDDGTLHGSRRRRDWGSYGWSGKCGGEGTLCDPDPVLKCAACPANKPVYDETRNECVEPLCTFENRANCAFVTTKTYKYGCDTATYERMYNLPNPNPGHWRGSSRQLRKYWYTSGG